MQQFEMQQADMHICQLQGHHQEDCRKRIKANKPCFDDATKITFWPKINSMDPTGANASPVQMMAEIFNIPLVDFHSRA